MRGYLSLLLPWLLLQTLGNVAITVVDASVEAIKWRFNPRWYFPPSLSISSFNVQAFGKAKARKEGVMDALVQVICQHDLTSILEIRDADLRVMGELMEKLNRHCKHTYNYAPSRRVGSTDLKEEIGFIYCLKSLTMVRSETVGGANSFERPPFWGHFKCINAPWFEFGVLAAHLKPDTKTTSLEMNALHRVYRQQIRANPGLSAAIVMGDLNADGKYLSREKLNSVHFSRPDYEWLIPSDVTTMVKTNKAYDRIIVDKRYLDAVKPQSAGVIEYPSRIRMPRDLKPQDISDHYPVGLQLIARKVSVDWSKPSLFESDEITKPAVSKENGKGRKGGPSVRAAIAAEEMSGASSKKPRKVLKITPTVVKKERQRCNVTVARRHHAVAARTTGTETRNS